MTQQNWQEKTQKTADEIRRLTLGVTIQHNGCYLSQALSSAEIFATLYTKILNLGPSLGEMTPPLLPTSPEIRHIALDGGRYHGAKAPDKDRLVISAAHYAVVVYTALAAIGRLDPESLKQFDTDGSTIEMIGAEHSPGFELTTGSFGQCISQAAGIAIARKKAGDTGKVYAFLGDGELQEGQTWEGVEVASFYKLDNLIIFVDVNGQQVDGYTKDVMDIEPMDKRFEAFGWQAIKVDGHDINALYKATQQPHVDKPLIVLCYTDSCRGLPLLEARKPKLHYVRFTEEERQQFIELYEQMAENGE